MRALIMSEAFARRLCFILRQRLSTLEIEIVRNSALTDFGRGVLQDQIEDIRSAIADLADDIKPMAGEGVPA